MVVVADDTAAPAADSSAVATSSTAVAVGLIETTRQRHFLQTFHQYY